MRKPVQIGLIVAVAILAVATTMLYVRYQQNLTAYSTMKVEEENTRQRYAQTLDAIAEIQDSLNTISVGDANVRMQPTMGAEGGKVNQQEALDRIATMRESIARNKTRIRQLESSLHKSGIKVAGLQKMVSGLKHSVEEKEAIVAELTTQVESLHTQVTGLQTEVAVTQDTLRTRDQTLEERRRELATVYYVIGSKKDLQNAGVIVANGGVLGLGKTIQPSGRFSEVSATALDTDQETVIQTPAAKVRVLSPQPAGSYELRLVDGHMELHILNAAEFRKVKQLVILTA
jgi:hypothetical protein